MRRFWLTYNDEKIEVLKTHLDAIIENPEIFHIPINGINLVEKAIGQNNIKIFLDEEFTSIFCSELNKEVMDRIWIAFPNAIKKRVIIDSLKPFRYTKFADDDFQHIYDTVNR